MALGCGHDQAVQHRQGSAGQFGPGGKPRPGMKPGGMEAQDAAGEALLHLIQPAVSF
jgi:hypothetical protein